ncbi:hypothetical protein CC2G_013577 [Coprinopsis cinerea AmutBmut pab1-1]|nr:hypothetical protein CC2G_013577 [Coprinopsis cinerea AmutBmut pab1-1]
MILLLLLLYSTLRPLHPGSAAPILESPVPDLLARASESFSDSCASIEFYDGIPVQTNYRSVADVIVTCLVTIFSCTWVSVHPNVRGYNSTTWERFLQRAEAMLWGIVAPELIVTWAIKQWDSARDINYLINEYLRRRKESGGDGFIEWRLVHSHFLQMGGYIFKRGDTLQWVDVCEALHHFESDETDLVAVNWATGYGHERAARGTVAKDDMLDALESLIHRTDTKEELADRSKTDALSKTFVVVQTSWFMMRCIARYAEGLAVTELELTTAAYALLNIVMYFCWWNKPLGVQCPIVVHVEPRRRPESDVNTDIDFPEKVAWKPFSEGVLSIWSTARRLFSALSSNRAKSDSEGTRLRRWLPSEKALGDFLYRSVGKEYKEGMRSRSFLITIIVIFFPVLSFLMAIRRIAEAVQPRVPSEKALGEFLFMLAGRKYVEGTHSRSFLIAIIVIFFPLVAFLTMTRRMAIVIISPYLPERPHAIQKDAPPPRVPYPSFYNKWLRRGSEKVFLVLPASLLGSAFGAVHCIAWMPGWHFSSPVLRLLCADILDVYLCYTDCAVVCVCGW